MDFQGFVDSVGMACCVLSAEKTAEGTCGQIRIVCANQIYKDAMGPAYYDNMSYDELVHKDKRFEEYVYRAAIGKERMHAYVDTTAFLNCWTDQTMIPLESDRDDMGYCQYIFESTPTQEADRMTFVSLNTASMVVRSCIKLVAKDDFKENVASVMEDIVDATGAMAGRIVLIDSEKKEAVLFSECIRQDIWPERDPENDVITYDLVTTWEELIGDNNAVIVQDEKDLQIIAEKNPEWAQSMREHRVTSLVLIPLRRNKKVLGYLFVVNINVEDIVEIKELLELISYFLASEISNYLFVQKLDKLTNFDDLTGLKSRYALMNRTHEILESTVKRPFGVINLDLNGLKVINDQQGHVAGDMALIKTANFLRRFFREEDLYRIGGDEFIILITGIGEEVFNRRVEKLKEASQNDGGLSYSVGSAWTDGTGDVPATFNAADRSMYQDKHEYYDRHPELRH